MRALLSLDQKACIAGLHQVKRLGHSGESGVKISVKPLLGNGILLYRLKSKLALLYYVLRHKFEETWRECRQVPLNCTQIVCHSRIP